MRMQTRIHIGATVVRDVTQLGQFCNYGCLAAYIEAEGRTNDATCEYDN